MNEEAKKPTKQELVEMLKEMNDNIEKLPSYALSSPCTNLDLSALIILLYAIHKAEV